MVNLLPCPFCGGKPEVSRNKPLRREWLFNCRRDCAVTAFTAYTTEEAIAKWNRRAFSASAAQL